MIGQRASRLADLAERDPTVAPLARLQLLALEAAADAAWERGIPSFGTQQLVAGAPLLHEQALGVDRDRLARLWRKLVACLAEMSSDASARAAITNIGSADTLPLVEAVITGDARRLDEMARQIRVEAGILTTLAQVVALPLLQACGRKGAELATAVSWDVGFCPICGAWPTLSELRGLERERWLRCGRCGAGWAFRRMTCVYCGNTDVRTQGYLAAEAEREARRAETCEACSGYLKAFAALGPMGPGALLAADLSTIEIDVTAIDQGYARPDGLGYPLKTDVQAIAQGKGWRPWGRS